MLTKTCQKLQDKCLGLENRSRRQNLRLVGENGNMSSFHPKEVLSVTNFDSPVVIDRAHRGQDETRDPLLNGETLNTGSRLDEGPVYVQSAYFSYILTFSLFLHHCGWDQTHIQLSSRSAILLQSENHQRKLNMMYAYWPQDATDKRDNLDSLIRINIASFRYSGRKNNSGMWL